MNKIHADALQQYGDLYRNDEGHEVWRITDAEGNVVAEDVASDFDAAWIAAQVNA